MPDRVVSYVFRGNFTNLTAGLTAAGRNVGELGAKMTALDKNGAKMRSGLTAIGDTAGKIGLVAAGGLALAVGAAARFDKAMSAVQAATHETSSNMDELRKAAIKAGADTVYSASEAAGAIEELAKAGVSTKDILAGGLSGSLNLAAAGAIDVADAAELAATAMTQFGLSGDQVNHVADLLSAGAGKAQGSVADLGMALKQSGLVAEQTGLSIEETVGTLSAFASAGMLGSDAGTSLRTMLLRLANPTKENAQLMEALGINAYDSTGRFVGLAGLAGELQTAFRGMTEEQKQSNLAMIFGQDAIRGATILLNEGKDGIQDYTRMVDDQGYAAETAAKRLDNLKGDIEALSGAVETGLIQMGESADGPGRFIVQLLTTMVDGFNELPDAGQSAVFWTGAVAGAVAIAGGIFLTAVPKVAEYNAAIEGMGPKVQRASRLVGTAMKGLGVGTAVIASWTLLSSAVDMAEESIFQISDKARNLTAENASLADSFDQLVNSGVSWNDVAKNQNDVLDRLGDLGNIFTYVGALDDTGRAAVGLSTALKGLSPALAAVPLEQAQEQFAGYVRELGATDDQVLSLLNNMPEFKDSIIAAAKAQNLAQDDATLLALAMGRIKPAADSATTGTQENVSALDELKAMSQDTETAVGDLADTIRGFGDATLDTRSAARDFQQAMDDLQASVKENGTTLDTTTQKGRDNEAAIDALATSVTEYAAATYSRTRSEEDAARVLAEGRAELIRMLEQFGITGEAAEAYADELGLIPEDVQTAIDINGWDTAMERARMVAASIRDIPGYRDVVINQVVKQTGAPRGEVGAAYVNANGGLYDYKAYANGGFSPDIYAGRTGAIHKFAEPETVWEAYISGKPDQRDRNIGIWQDTGRRLGVEQGGSKTIVNVDQTVQALPGMSTETVAQAAARQIRFEMRSSL